MEQKKMSAFEELSKLNVNDKTEKKNGLTYISWAWAWSELKKRYPDSSYRVYENADGWMYHTDGRTAWVKVGVTIDGAETVEYLPIMDVRNRSIPLKDISSMDANKAVQRAVTRAIARAGGLGLYLYAGEEIPEEDEEPKPKQEQKTQEQPKQEETPAPKTDKALSDQRKKVLDYAEAKFGKASDILPQLGATMYPKRTFNSLTIPELQGLFDAMKEFEEGITDDQNVC